MRRRRVAKKKYNIFLTAVIIFLNTSCTLFDSKPSPVNDSLILYDYRPFMINTRAVKLRENSTLKITDNLPIIDGATALYPLYAAFVQAVYPKGEYRADKKRDPDDYTRITPPIVDGGSTSEAYKNLIDGTADMIFCARPSVDQIEKARKEGIAFNLTPIGKEAFVFFVNKRNPVSNLTTEQIKGIYSGRITNWTELGGKNESIRVYQRSKNSGSQTILEWIMGDKKIIEPIKENVQVPMIGIVNHVADYRNYNDAIGYSFLFYTTRMVQNNKIKLLSINDIAPSTETIQDGTYPYADYFYVITTNTKNENVKKFIEWILSDQGQYLVKKTGYVPIK